MKSVSACELVGRGVSVAVFLAKSTTDEWGWFAVWHDNGLPDASGADGADVFILKVAQELILRMKKGGRRKREAGTLCGDCEIFENRLAWETRPLD